MTHHPIRLDALTDDAPSGNRPGASMEPTGSSRRDPRLTHGWHLESHVHPDGAPARGLTRESRAACPWCTFPATVGGAA